jgi:hypothetical protein
MTTGEIFQSWQKPQTTSVAANEVWPDAALRAPFPFRILFEAKYFEKESQSDAQDQLVKGIHETAFYRGLPMNGDSNLDVSWLTMFRQGGTCGKPGTPWPVKGYFGMTPTFM